MHTLMRLVIGGLGLAVGITTLNADDKTPYTDQMFVEKAASGGMHEVELGKLAKDKATSPGVKAFGQRMVTDHSKANDELMKVAKAAGIPVPAKAADEHQMHVQKFAKLTGSEFDAAYIKHMVKDHHEDIALFEKASQEAKNPQIKEFATKTLPTLKEHLKMAEQLSGGPRKE